MDFRSLIPLVIFGGGFALVATVLYGAWMLGRYHGRDEGTTGDLESVQARLYTVEQAMLRVAHALDRLEAANHMTARILSDIPSSNASSSHRLPTPH